MSSTVIPTLRYQDAPKAIDRLSQAFGFEPQLVVEATSLIDHAQLISGPGMIIWAAHVPAATAIG